MVRNYIPTGRRRGAPDGIEHGKATHSLAVVEWVRDLHEFHNLGPRAIVDLLPCLRIDTVRDWVYYRTRTRA